MKKILILIIFSFATLNSADFKENPKCKQYMIEFILKKDFKTFKEKSIKLGTIKNTIEDWKLVKFEFNEEVSESEAIALFDKNHIGNYKIRPVIKYYAVGK